MPRDWQYERFSYVVLRRGNRPTAAPEVFIEPGFRMFGEDEELLYANLPPKLLAALQSGGNVDPLEIFPFLRDAPINDAEADDDAQLKVPIHQHQGIHFQSYMK